MPTFLTTVSSKGLTQIQVTHGEMHATGSSFVPNIHMVQIFTEKCDCSFWLELGVGGESCERRKKHIWKHTRTGVSIYIRGMLCAFQCVFVCVVIIEALLLLWEFADVNFWLQCGLRMKGVYCFITHKCCSGKRCNITAKTWTEFRPACGPSEENSRESAVQSPLHLPQTHGRVCWSSRVVDTRAAEKTQVY